MYFSSDRMCLRAWTFYCFFVSTWFFLTFSTSSEVRIGVAGPFSGPHIAFGQQMRQGTESAIEALNARGGLLGESVVLLAEDDSSDPRQGISVAHKFAAQNIRFLVGHYGSGLSIPTSLIYAENGILQISPGATNPVYTDRGLWNTFRVIGRDDDQGRIAAAYIARYYKGKNIAIIHDRTPYGKGLADATQKTLNHYNLVPVLSEGINPGEKDYSALISKLKAAHVDFVYYGGAYNEFGLIARQTREQNLMAALMSGDGIMSSEFPAIAGASAQGVLMTFPPEVGSHESAQAALRVLKSRGVQPGPVTLAAYAAVEVLEQAVRGSNSLDPYAVAEFLRAGPVFQTVLGPIAFNEKGDVTLDYRIYRWELIDGHFVAKYHEEEHSEKK
jgi:branched-chain amino acid transport system substrate-binding protein